MFNKIKNYLENNMESIAMALAAISYVHGNDYTPFNDQR